VSTTGSTVLGFGTTGSTLVTYAGTTQLWNTAAGAEAGSPFTTVSGATAVALSADGADLASADDDGTVTLWKLPDRRQAGSPLPASAARGASPVFSPGGSNLAPRRWATAGVSCAGWTRQTMPISPPRSPRC
jgi:WD40 repeat protein